MARDEETGIDPVSKDGEGLSQEAKDELAKQRAKREGNGGGSSAARGAEAESEAAGGEEDDGQLFVWEQGRKVTLGTLIARGTPVEYHVVFGGRRNRGGGGLRGFGEKPLLIVRGGIGPVKIVPTYDDDEKVTKVAVEQHIVAKIVADAETEDGLALIAHILDAKGYVRSGKAS